jgi:hypothetical protein
MLKDILFVIKELIPVGKSIYKSIKNAKDKDEKNRIKEAVRNDPGGDLVNSIIRGD